MATTTLSSGTPFFHRFTFLLTGLALTLSVAVLANPAYSQESVVVSTSKPAANRNIPLQDGVYLYGQSAQANQLGSTYTVFEVNRGRVVGAFYMPASSFDCYKGKLQPDQMALTVVNSEDRQAYPYAVALQRNGDTTAAGNAALNPVTLAGFHPLANLSANDRRILSVCKADLDR